MVSRSQHCWDPTKIVTIFERFILHWNGRENETGLLYGPAKVPSYTPHLITQELPPVNYLIQRTKRVSLSLRMLKNSWNSEIPKFHQSHGWLISRISGMVCLRGWHDAYTALLWSAGNATEGMAPGLIRKAAWLLYDVRCSDDPEEVRASSDDQDREPNTVKEENMAIAEDSMSTPRLRVLPPRVIRRPARYLWKLWNCLVRYRKTVVYI